MAVTYKVKMTFPRAIHNVHQTCVRQALEYAKKKKKTFHLCKQSDVEAKNKGSNL